MKAALALLAIAFGISTLKPKKRKKKKGGGIVLEDVVVSEWTPGGGGGGGGQPPAPGDLCPQSMLNDGEHAVYGEEEGECIVFWTDGVTDEQFRELLVEIWEEVGEPNVCAADVYNEVGDYWEPNPQRQALLVEALAEFYEQPEGAFPPAPGGPVWIDEVWAMGTEVLREEFCGGHTYG